MDKTESPGSAAAHTSSGSTAEASGAGSGSDTTAASGSQSSSTPTPPKSYADKVQAARAKVGEAKAADPKGATSGVPATNAGKPASNSDGTHAAADGAGSSRGTEPDEATKRVEELGRAARTAREEAARAKKERETLATERAALSKEREEAKADLDLSKQLKALKADGKYAEAWALFAGDKAHDMEVFTQIAERVSGNDGTVSAADVAKMVESKLEDAEKAREAAAAEAKKAKEKESDEKREKAWAEYLDTESEDPNERGVIPTYTADKTKWPAIQARGASRETLMKVTRELRAKNGTVPTSTELLDEVNRRLDADIEREAKARGYVKPETKKPPPAQDPRGGSPRPRADEAERKPGESAYQAKIRAAKAQLRS